jgi:DNA mismatch repair protein MutS
VAKLAGIPKPALNFAREKLLELEKNALGLERHNPKKSNLSNENNDLKESSAAKKAISQADLFLSDNSALNEALSALNPDQMSPMAALEALYQLKKLL